MSAAADLKTLYRETVLDHSRQPRNFHRLEHCNRSAQGHNPLCGDKLTVYLRVEDTCVADAAFEGTGCAICMASASIMTESVRGRSVEAAGRRAEQIIAQFRRPEGGTDEMATLGVMAALAGVRAYPSRIKCAILAWKTLEAALSGDDQTITTE